jgi:hypothetical protein
MAHEHQNVVAEILSRPDVMIAADDTDFSKKTNNGDEVVGQNRRNFWKTDKRRVEKLEYVGVYGRGLVDFDRYMPEIWFYDAHTDSQAGKIIKRESSRRLFREAASRPRSRGRKCPSKSNRKLKSGYT